MSAMVAMQTSQQPIRCRQPAPARVPSAERGGGRALRDRGGQTVWSRLFFLSLPTAATSLLLLACDSSETCPEGYTCTADGGGGSAHS